MALLLLVRVIKIIDGFSPVFDHSQKGDDIYPRTIIKRKENGWLLQSNIAPDIRVIEHIENLLAIALPQKNHFEKLPEGTDVAIYCIVYSEFGRPDISLKPDMVKAIASLGAALDFDLYTLGDD